ncbi:hypothetical protein ACET3Z_026627 [Daucus carota]|uniref:Uncharacterized protein n=1 Tax=Daucus carota subsp. sativus TaxID=79200 RepID=A0A164U2J2_DAUCS|nr:PREDICTED: uncharacterized protein LOC108195328 [Daucus carota subsp. sativus]
MDKMVTETLSQSTFTPNQSHETEHDRYQEADTNSPSSGSVIRKISTPDRLKVPKPFKYPERYTSPTDLMVSPVSKGVIARTRKTGPLLPPSNSQNEVCRN